jgi:hypothetical protein
MSGKPVLCDLTAEYLRGILHYDPATGAFKWLVRLSKRTRIGQPAGSPTSHGSLIRINKKQYRSHRLAWLYVHGKWPDLALDHINGNPHDNRMENIREATPTQNMQNKKGMGSLKKGVVRNHRRYGARIKVDKVAIWLGTYDTEEEAHHVYMDAARFYFGEFARFE